jgi:drug/metabolite transporter (DMT)-like permease
LPGYLAAGAAVLVLAGWIVVVRFAMTEAVAPELLALFRYGIPALVLAPVWLRRGVLPRGRAGLALLLMTLGWGAPFVFWTAEGLRHVPASLFGPLVPGLMPILAALLGLLFFGESLSRAARAGMALIGISLALLLGQWIAGGGATALAGAPYLVAAAFGWAVYAVMFRRSGLSPIEATGLVGLWSLPIVGFFILLRGDPFAGLAAGEIAFHAVTQGLVTGLGAVLAYGFAIQRLGMVRASAIIALVPVCAAVMGVAFLGETIGALDWLAVALTSLGVATANGALDRWLARAG